MSFIKRSGLVIVCILLFIVILVGNILLTLGLSLRYENIQNELVPVVKEVAIDNFHIEEELNADFDSLADDYCDNYEDFVFNREGYTLVFPCEVIQNGSDAFVSYGVDAFVREIYYKNYECGFWDCFGNSENPKTPFFLVSAQSQSYWMGKFYWALFLFLFFAGLIYLLAETNASSFLITGSLLVVGSLPFLAIGKIASWFVEARYLEFAVAFLSSASSVFWISFILGLVFFGVGLGFKFWNLKEWISEKFGKKKK